MNSLGRDSKGCDAVLKTYCQAIGEVLDSTRDEKLATRAHAQLEALLFDLDVDTGSRTGDLGYARMTDVEATLLAPALRKARHALQSIAPRDPPHAWQGALLAAMNVLHSTAPRIEPWQRSAGARAYGDEPAELVS